MTSSTDLAALLCSRLCHDMLSPVGALSNGLELLADEKDPEMRKRCFELLEQSAKDQHRQAQVLPPRLRRGGRFRRRGSRPMSRAKLVHGLIAANERVEFEWAVADATLPKPAVKVLLNLASIAIRRARARRHAGDRRRARDGATEIAVRAAGPRVAFDGNIGKALDGSLATRELSGKTAPRT
jgi:histidine phosphotransferase ChpT